jgi:hypothetical protein
VDFTSVRRLVAEYYSPDQGRGADDPVLLFKLLVLPVVDPVHAIEVRSRSRHD